MYFYHRCINVIKHSMLFLQRKLYPQKLFWIVLWYTKKRQKYNLVFLLQKSVNTKHFSQCTSGLNGLNKMRGGLSPQTIELSRLALVQMLLLLRTKTSRLAVLQVLTWRENILTLNFFQKKFWKKTLSLIKGFMDYIFYFEKVD